MASTSSPSADTARDLLRRNADLATWLADLGTRGADAARALAQPGVPPPGDYLEELTDAGREFASLREQVLKVVAQTALPAPAVDEITSTREIDALLRALIDELERQARLAAAERARSEALALLDRIAALTHRDDRQFAPLMTCQGQARDLRSTIAGSTDSERSTWAGALAPFTALLTLIDGQQALSDDAWAALEDSVAGAFGRPLAVAATRRKLAAS